MTSFPVPPARMDPGREPTMQFAVALVEQKQVLYLVKVGAAIFFDLHPYIVAPIGATDKLISYYCTLR